VSQKKDQDRSCTDQVRIWKGELNKRKRGQDKKKTSEPENLDPGESEHVGREGEKCVASGQATGAWFSGEKPKRKEESQMPSQQVNSLKRRCWGVVKGTLPQEGVPGDTKKQPAG